MTDARAARDPAAPPAPDLVQQAAAAGIDAQTLAQAQASQVGSRYSWYVLGVLTVIYAVNFIDRQILAILAPDIARDLDLSLADLGFLYGTAFAVFYALFGIPLGRLADMWYRGRLMALGLTLWSGMTVLSGFATSFAQLSLARIGVGVGEASASPCAYSLISDYFPKAQRATAIAIYSAGLYAGVGISLYAGGAIVELWESWYPDGNAPLGLRGWQAAFIAAGTPGLVLAVLVALMREPIRGLPEGIITPIVRNPWPKFMDEMTSVLPPFTVLHLIRHGGRAKVLGMNVLAAGCTVAGVLALTALLGDWRQWAAVGIGFYAVFSWAQSVHLRDRPTFGLIWGTPTFVLLILAAGMIAFTTYALSYFSVQYAMPRFGLGKDDAGLVIGLPSAVAAAAGSVLGGIGADRLRRRRADGRVLFVMIALVVTFPLALATFNAGTLAMFILLFFLLNLTSALWLGGIAASTQDLVLPRMRGAATASLFLGTTLLGLAFGPYVVGKIADLAMTAQGFAGSAAPDAVLASALRTGILNSYWLLGAGLLLLQLARMRLEQAEVTRVTRARALGEPA